MRATLFLLCVSLVWAQSSPQISPGGIVGAGLSNPPLQVIAPNALVSIFGANFAPAGTVRDVGAADLVNGALPTTLGGVCVEIGGTAAFMINVRPNQLNVQSPSGLDPTQPATVQVVTNCGQPNEARSDPMNVNTSAAAPELFYATQSADGNNPIAGINVTTKATLSPSAAVKPGDILTLYATGLGATSPSIAAGQLPGSAANVNNVSVSIGGVVLDPASLLYAGVTPGDAGLYQINLQVPPTAPDGQEPLEVYVGTATSPINGVITMSNPAVPAPCAAPVIDVFSSDPPYLTASGSVDLSWWVENATSVSISPGKAQNLPLEGDTMMNQTSSTTYTLTANGTCGTTTSRVQVPVGAPALTGFQAASTGAPAGGLRAGDVATFSAAIDPSVVQGVVFTAPTGEEYVAQIEFVDAQGLLYFRVPYVPELNAATGPVQYRAGTLIEGQVMGGVNVTFLPLTYAGNALADFKALTGSFFGPLQTGVASQSQSSDLAPAVDILSATVTAYRAVIDRMNNDLAASGSAQVPDDLPNSSNAAPANETVTTRDIANIMAYVAVYREGDAILNPPATSSIRPAFKTSAMLAGLKPGTTNPGKCLSSVQPLGATLSTCLGYQQAQDAVLGAALGQMGSWSGAASSVAPTAAKTAASALSKFNNAKLAADSTCKLASIWLRNFTVYPLLPASLQHFTLNPNFQDVSVFANLGSGDFAGDILSYAESQAVNGILAKVIPQNTPGVGDRALAIVKTGNGYLKDQLKNAMNKLPPAKPSDTEQVGTCDLTDFYSEREGSHSSNKTPTPEELLIVKEEGPMVTRDANGYLFQYSGKKNNTIETMYVVPNPTHFLMDSSVRLSVGPGGTVRFPNPLAVGSPKWIQPSGNVQLQGEGANQNMLTADLPEGGKALPRNGHRTQTITGTGAASALVSVQQTGNSTYQVTEKTSTDLTSITGPSSLWYFNAYSVFKTLISNPAIQKRGQPAMSVSIIVRGQCVLYSVFSASDGTNSSNTDSVNGSLSRKYSAKATNGNFTVSITNLSTPNATCSATSTISLSDQ